MLGKRVAVAGPLAGMTRREAADLLRRHGAIFQEKPDATADIIAVGEGGLLLADDETGDLLDDALRKAVELGTLEVIGETELWRRLGLADAQTDLNRLYTPAMLAELLAVPVNVIRRWHGMKLIVPEVEIRKLPYFAYQEVATARRLAQLLSSGMSPKALEKKLDKLARLLPGVARPLAQLSIMIEGKKILLKQGGGLVEPGGQWHFDFDSSGQSARPVEPIESPTPSAATLASLHGDTTDMPSAAELRQLAVELEEEGRLADAADMCRAALAAEGPNAEICFQLAELLYRQGEAAAAFERYSMALEIDEDYVEARVNLGCVLIELGRRELAVAAFEGALRYHSGYADAYYHLASTLDALGRRAAAEAHWRTFLAMAPESPWAAEAVERLG